MIKKICIFLGSRANYSSIKSVMMEIKNNKNLKLHLILGASAILNKHGELES